MAKLQLKQKDSKGNVKNAGVIEIKNQTEDSAELYFYGDIISESMSENYRNYYPDDKCPQDIKDFMDEIGDVGNLDIHINSGGGSVFGGIAIYNLLKQKKCKKTVYVDGIAASIASVIACVGDKIVMPENATFMIHKPSNGYFFTSMNADDLRKDADTLDKCQEAILNTYMTKAKEGVTAEKINELINAESWLIGSKAAEYFDFEIEETIDAAACASDYFSKYHNLPENLKPKDLEQKPKAKEVPKENLLDESKIKELINQVLDSRCQQEKENEKEELLKGLDNYGI